MTDLAIPDVHSEEVLAALGGEDFLLFVQLFFHVIEPGRTFHPSWHIDHIAYLLDGVANGTTKRLIINQPPRSLKSVLISVLFVAFLMGNDPSLKVIVASHTKELARKLASDFRRVVNDPLFKKIFPHFELDRGGDSSFLQRTTLNGHRIATSVGGTITGSGADLIIVDDPNRAKDVYSEAHRNRVNTYFDQELSSRLNNKIEGRILIVMQRLHEDDLTGHVLGRNSNWSHAVIQAICAEPRAYRTGYAESDVYRRELDDILLPQMNSVDSLDDLRAQNGSINFEAQYQQNPAPADGLVIKREWLHYYERAPYEFDFVMCSWDLASSIEEDADFSVGTAWGLKDGYFYLLDCVRGRYEAWDLRRRIEDLHASVGANVTVIEKAGIGDAIGQDMRRQGRVRPLLMPVRVDKKSRMMAESPKFESRRVVLPKDAPWLGVYVKELLSFPTARNDDQVDSTSQALSYLNSKLPPPVRLPKPDRVSVRPRGNIGRRNNH